jgi:hypothetical protein
MIKIIGIIVFVSCLLLRFELKFCFRKIKTKFLYLNYDLEGTLVISNNK